MSRKEAVSIYLDALLGFRCGFTKFQEATKMLNDEEMQQIQEAVSARTRNGSRNEKSFYFSNK